METILWALDLLAVVYVCRWAYMADGGSKPKKFEGK